MCIVKTNKIDYHQMQTLFIAHTAKDPGTDTVNNNIYYSLMHAILGSILYCAISCFVFVNNFARLKMLQAQEKIEPSNEMIFNDSDN